MTAPKTPNGLVRTAAIIAVAGIIGWVGRASLNTPGDVKAHAEIIKSNSDRIGRLEDNLRQQTEVLAELRGDVKAMRTILER